MVVGLPGSIAWRTSLSSSHQIPLPKPLHHDSIPRLPSLPLLTFLGLSCFFRCKLNKHMNIKYIYFKVSNKSNTTPPCYQSSYRHPSLKKKQESNQRPNFGSHLGNLLSFKLIIRLKSLESRLDGFKRKKPFKTTSGTWALGPSSWPRGAYLGWPCIGSEPI